MNLLDENFPQDQALLLREYKVPVRQIGKEVAALGTQDENILPILHGHRNATFFTQDQDFFSRRLCHDAYCLVWLDLRPRDTAEFVRRFLRHPQFVTHAQRMGTVVRVHYDGLHYWTVGQANLLQSKW